MKTTNTIAPLTTAMMTTLISEGKANEIVSYTQRYEEQQLQISQGVVKMARVTVKLNKADGLYLAHPAFASSAKGGLNYNKHLIPAIQALVTDEHLFNMVRDFFLEGTVVDKHVIIEND